jgi:hypothetical protein
VNGVCGSNANNIIIILLELEETLVHLPSDKAILNYSILIVLLVFNYTNIYRNINIEYSYSIVDYNVNRP